MGEQIRWMLAATLYNDADDDSTAESTTSKDDASTSSQMDVTAADDRTGWVNVGLDTHEQFLSLRNEGKLLFNQLPLLEIDGMRLVCSNETIKCDVLVIYSMLSNSNFLTAC